MSRSYKETSVPNQRGRKGVLKTKRRSSKLVRHNEDVSDRRTEKILRTKFVIDK